MYLLKDAYMPIPNINQWNKIAEQFYLLWNLPNCVGAIDGKHMRIEKLPKSGSSNFNYKTWVPFCCINPHACCDADGLVTFIETGFAGRNSDGGVFRASAIKSWIENETSGIPLPSRLPKDESNNDLPHYFVGDEAFPLLRYLMRPYPQRSLDNVKRVYNYRLSRGRKTIECTLGMQAENIYVLNSPIRCRNPQKITNIEKGKVPSTIHDNFKTIQTVLQTQTQYHLHKIFK